MLPQSSLNQLPRLHLEEIHMKKYEVLHRSLIPATYQIQTMYINLKENKVQITDGKNDDTASFLSYNCMMQGRHQPGARAQAR